jgi:hypothetical protein
MKATAETSAYWGLTPVPTIVRGFPKASTWCQLSSIQTQAQTSVRKQAGVWDGLTNEFRNMFTYQVRIQTLQLIDRMRTNPQSVREVWGAQSAYVSRWEAVGVLRHLDSYSSRPLRGRVLEGLHILIAHTEVLTITTGWMIPVPGVPIFSTVFRTWALQNDSTLQVVLTLSRRSTSCVVLDTDATSCPKNKFEKNKFFPNTFFVLDFLCRFPNTIDIFWLCPFMKIHTPPHNANDLAPSLIRKKVQNWSTSFFGASRGHPNYVTGVVLTVSMEWSKTNLGSCVVPYAPFVTSMPCSTALYIS